MIINNVPILGSKNNFLFKCFNINSRTYPFFILFSAAHLLALILINPLYVLISLTIFNLFFKVKLYILVLWGFCFSTLLFKREYNIDYIFNSGADDVIGYTENIRNLKFLSFKNIFNPQVMTGYEPVAQIIWWILIKIGLSVNQIIFIQLFSWVTVLVVLANFISNRFSVLVLMIGLGLYAQIIPIQFHSLYRSAWAFTFFALSLVYYKDKPINILSGLAFFSHFAIGFVIFIHIAVSKKIFNLKSLALGLLAMIVFFELNLLEGLLAKLIHYSSSYTHVYHQSIVLSQLLGMATLLLFYSFSAKDRICKSLFYTTGFIFIFTFIPFVSWISMRLFVIVAPLAFMVCAPLRNVYVLFGVSCLCLFRFISNISSESSVYNAWGTEFMFVTLTKLGSLL
mgnify:CR=1 FL=1